MKSIATEFHKLGFAIHWLKNKSKAPVESKWTTGPRKDLKSLKNQFRPGMNIGVRLGEVSRIDKFYLGVIDCDVKSPDKRHRVELNKRLENLLEEAGFAGGFLPTVLSGRGNGSKHIYFVSKAPLAPRRYTQSTDTVEAFMPSAKPSKNDVKVLGESKVKKGLRLRPAWEISIMGDGQQVVLPPSIHPDSNKPYKWKNDKRPLSPKDFPLLKIKGGDKSKIEKTVLEDFTPEPVDILFSDLNDNVADLIINGKNCNDRSAGLLSACRAMVSHGFTDNQILTVLTDKENFLGDVAYEHTKSNSRKRAANWVLNYTLKKAKADLDVDKMFSDEVEFEEPDDEDDAREGEEQLWKAKIERNKQDGAPKPTFKNIKIILEGECGEKLLARDEFAMRDTWQVDTPWGSKKGDIVSDDDSILIKDWLAQKWRLEPSTDRIDEVLVRLSLKNAHHPVRKFLTALEWDGKPRLDTWLKDYLNAHDAPDEYLKAIGSRFVIGMVARIFEPGVKFDTMLILEGKQGVGKSTAARILAGNKWFSDSPLDLGDKDAVMNMLGIWVWEMGELATMSRADVRQLKEFVSSSVDKIRPPYGHRMVEHPRQSVFFGTTNDDEYLKDKTGNRRYWPVKVESVNLRKLKRDRKQILAEAVARYASGERFYIDRYEEPNLYVLVETQQGLRLERDAIVDGIADFMKDKANKRFRDKEFRLIDLMESDGAFMTGIKNDRAAQMRIAGALKEIGFISIRKMLNGVNAKWWTRVANLDEKTYEKRMKKQGKV